MFFNDSKTSHKIVHFFMGVDVFILNYFWSTAVSIEKFQMSSNCDLHLPLSIVFWFSILHPFLRLVMIYTEWWKLQILVFNLGSCRHFLNQLCVFASLYSAHFFFLLSCVLADLALKFLWMVWMPSNRFQISRGPSTHKCKWRTRVSGACTILVSVHLSFDNKNALLKLSREHKTKRQGSGIVLHALWKAWLIQLIITSIYFSLMKNSSHRFLTWGNKQARESSHVEPSAVHLCISSCQIMVGSMLGPCYYPGTNLLKSNIHEISKRQWFVCCSYQVAKSANHGQLSTCVIS